VLAAADPTHQLAAPVEGPAALASSPAGRVRALPKVRAAAERLGVDLATVAGTGPRGTLTVQDVERAAAQGASTANAADADGRPAPAELERRQLTGARKAMAAGVSASWAEVPQFVQQFRVDVTAVQSFRAGLKERGDGVGLTAVLAAAIAHAVQAVPEVNSTLTGDQLVLHRDVNVGIAVNSERGLVVPTVAQADAVGVVELDQRIRSAVDHARAGSLPPDTPTITLSNLGGYGVETGMPLVSRGQSAIVFTGDIIDTPVVENGSVVVRPMLGIAVGYDHRVIDGTTGGEFCRALRSALEEPGVLEQAVSRA
jgi:pyruvate dehydrogenase E2 component (dihydrolipoamide acetyltransferase)